MRKVIHVDMDAFDASVEQRDNPALRGRTVKVKFADLRRVTRSRSFSVIARHLLRRQASIELLRTLLPSAEGVRLLGVTVSTFELASVEADDEQPLFGAGAAILSEAHTASRAAATGAR